MTLGSHQQSIGKSQDWITPRSIIDDLGPFDLDPCASMTQPWSCAVESWTGAGLLATWRGLVWLNPPFNRYEVGKWVERLAAHNNGIALLHARTEADWFAPVWEYASVIGFLKDRLYFHYPDGRRAEANSGAPAVLAAFGNCASERLFRSKIPMRIVTQWTK